MFFSVAELGGSDSLLIRPGEGLDSGDQNCKPNSNSSACEACACRKNKPRFRPCPIIGIMLIGAQTFPFAVCDCSYSLFTNRSQLLQRDTLIDNELSQFAHRVFGYQEYERHVRFRKRMPDSA